MPEPIFDATTERVYERLPEFYRTEDEVQNWTMKRWLSGICAQVDVVNTLQDRLDYTPPEDGVPSDTSDLVDPSTADASWLPWLAQIVGVRPERYATTADVRTAISNALTGAQPGTKEAIANAARTVLTGTKTVSVYPASTASGIGTGGQWDILILTISSETTSDPAAAVVAQGAKPAGVLLHAATLESTWTEIEAGFPTWADIDAGTWSDIEEIGL